MIGQKCDLYGKKLILVNPKYTTQTCSVMKGDKKLPLSVREWTCPECGAHHLRDINAAQNILNRALRDKAGHQLIHIKIWHGNSPDAVKHRQEPLSYWRTYTFGSAEHRRVCCT